MLTIKIGTRTPAFDSDSPKETASILRWLADAIEGGLGSRQPAGSIRDANGNIAGDWEWQE
jgi:hypothetical protein